jgi:hypothetical protein
MVLADLDESAFPARVFPESAFRGVPFRTMPFYSGDPWFLPLAMGLYAVQDKFKTTSK